MFRDLLGAFTDLFTERRSRLEVSALLLTMAMLPVSELLVTRMFSHLVLDGAERLQADRTAVVVAGAGFFAAFAASRALHHVVRLNRVRVFRRGFESSDARRPAHQEAWSWAAAFELSTASVALIQVLAFSLLFVWLDPVFGALNIVIGAGVLALVALVYRRQLRSQLAYLTEERGAATGVGERVGRRLRDAELGAVLASLAMAVALGLVLLRAVTGALAGADAIVLFIGLRMMYSQIGHLSASAMRFARVRARLAHGSSPGGADPDDEGGADDDAGEAEVRAADGLPPAGPTPHRARLVRQMLRSGQAGDLPQVQAYAARLQATTRPRPQETDAEQGAEAFALLAAPAEHAEPVPLMWWSRPLPGTVGNWTGPLVVRRLTGHPVTYLKPTATAGRPHLLVSGAILGSAQESSIVVGAGALGPDVHADPRAQVVSVRGPLSAAALRRAGGPSVVAYGDPTVLAARVLPMTRPAPNGRLALLRHASQTDLAVSLPPDVDELSTRVSRPEDLERLLATLVAYDGVVTSDPGVTALCHGYGLPCATVALEERADLDFVLRDQSLGLGLDVAPAHRLGVDLGRVRLRDLLETRVVDAAVLDAVQQRLEDAVTLCLEQAAPVQAPPFSSSGARTPSPTRGA